MDETLTSLVERLTRLGFSLYEARTYVGLLVHGTQTGYGLSNLTGVPQPKVYETLRRLAEQGAVIQTASKPATYAAVPAEQVLRTLDADFRQRLQDAKDDLERLVPRTAEDQREPIWKLNSFERIVARATEAIAGATRSVYLSGSASALEPLKDAVNEAAKRGVIFVVLHFGPLPFSVPGGRTFRHASTEGTLYFHHQARHLAVVVDSAATMWALARDGKHWQGLYSQDETFASAIKGYIRHDIMVQRMYADLPQELTDLYGPGLLELARISSSSNEGEAATIEEQELTG
jgi:HTH-type transcriptional regulator, sugar sensing transcriptional regulator